MFGKYVVDYRFFGGLITLTNKEGFDTVACRLVTVSPVLPSLRDELPPLLILT